jgi:signal transduction histidine kinase
VAVDIAIRPELADPPTGGPDAGARMARTNIYLERRTNPGSKTIVAVRSLTAGRWRLLVQPAAGSLDTLVAGQRRRNLMLSFGMLVLLAVSVGILLTIARRSQRLATQQMEFVATISHELRTPLAVIRSAAQNLSAGVIDRPDQARRYGELIDGEGRRLGDMVEQILQFAGLSAPRSLAIRPVNVAALIRELVASCEPLCRDARVRVDVDIDGPAPLAAADPESLRTALQNLVANAIKHGASGGWVRVAVCTMSGGVFPVVRIDVADGGRGISAEDLPHVFEPFYRGRYAVDRQLRGNGLGLALVKRIAEAHRGAVSVQSAADQGATFTLDIPAASTLHDRPAHQVAFS